VTPEALRAQLALLRRRGYRGVTFTEAVEGAAQGKRVAVTFDDAFASVETLAAPILDELGWPATVFAVTDFAREGKDLHWAGVDRWAGTEHAAELRSLDWERLRRLAASGWEVGSHTVTHPHLTSLDDDALARELTASLEAVEQHMRTRCTSIAYPFGDVDARVVEATRRAGYRTAAALPARWLADTALEFPRAGIYYGDDLRRFRLKVSPTARAVRRRLGR
jgi:peptidoglycan/xylan/chitin deacetylase (PgdA/CDA1 family)